MAKPLKPTAIVRKKMDRNVVLLKASSSRKNASRPKPASYSIAYGGLPSEQKDRR